VASRASQSLCLQGIQPHAGGPGRKGFHVRCCDSRGHVRGAMMGCLAGGSPQRLVQRRRFLQLARGFVTRIASVAGAGARYTGGAGQMQVSQAGPLCRPLTHSPRRKANCEKRDARQIGARGAGADLGEAGERERGNEAGSFEPWQADRKSTSRAGGEGHNNGTVVVCRHSVILRSRRGV